jgi:integrase
MKGRVMKAKMTTVNGKPGWVVNLSAKLLGKRQRVYGATKEKALAAAAAALDEHQEFGRELKALTIPERALMIRWRGRLTIEQIEAALSAAVEHHQPTLMTETAVRRYIETKAADSKKRHLQSLNHLLGAFARSFAGKPLGAIRPGEIDTYLHTKGASAPNHYGTIRALFRHAMLHEWVFKNPVVGVPAPTPRASEKPLLTVDQMRAALAYAATSGDIPLLRYLVTGGFCGLRRSEITRARCEEIALSDAELFVGRMKTERRGIRERYVELLPSALLWYEWMQLPSSGLLVELNEKNLNTHRLAMQKAIKLTAWPRNALRRSFASYHLAAFENSAKTAAQMGHTSDDTTFAKYRKARRKADGEAWFALTPEVVLGPNWLALRPAAPVQ